MRGLLQKRSVVAVFVVLVAVVSIGMWSLKTSAFEVLTNTWPNPGQFDTNGGTATNYLIDSNHGDSKNAYFSIFLPRTGSYALRYDNISCSSNVTTNNANLYFYIDEQGRNDDNNLDDDTDRDVSLYSRTEMCTDRDISIPARPAGCENSLIGNRCRVNIRVRMTCTRDPNCNFTDGMVIRYNLQVLQGGSPASGAVIAPMKDRSGEDNGIIFRRNTNNYLGRAELNFGISCTEAARIGTIRFADTDPTLNGGQGAVRARIRVTDLAGNTTTLNLNASQRSGTNEVGSGASLYYRLSQSGHLDVPMQPGYKYQVAFWNIFTQGTSDTGSYGSNYVSMSVPGDGIYGSDDYECWRLTPSIGTSQTGTLSTGTNFNVNGTINNISSTTLGESVFWRMYRFVGPATWNPPTGTRTYAGGNDPFLNSHQSTVNLDATDGGAQVYLEWLQSASSTGQQAFINRSSLNTVPVGQSIPASWQGRKVCYVMVLDHPWRHLTSGNNVYIRSGFSCVTVASPTWTIGGSVRAYSAASGGTTVTTAKPGQTVYFDYRLWNNGPDRSTNITYTTNGSAGNGSPRALNSGENIAARSSLEPVYIPTNATNGQTICRTLAWSPDTQAGGSGNAQGCVTVNFTFNIGGSVTAYSAATGGTTHGTAGQGEDRTVYVTPGTSLYFGYRLWNQAGSDTSASITYRYGAGATVSGGTVSGGTAGANSPRTIPGTTTGTPPPNNINAAVAASNNLNDSRIGPLTIPLDALNSRPADCRSLAWAPDTQASANGAMARLCVQVRYTYILTPHVNLSGGGVLTPGDPITSSPSISNETYTANPTDWVLRRFIAPAGVSVASVTSGSRTAGTFNCNYYYTNGLAKTGTCVENVANGTTGTFTGSLRVGDSSGYTYSDTGSLALGEKVCYALYINSHTETANQPAEAVSCATVAKYPALTVEQGMVRTGGAFTNTSGVCQFDATNPSGVKSNILMHDYNSTARGSYGLAGLAVGRINYFGSHNEYYGKETSDTLRRSLLFANSQNDDNKGYFLGATPASTFCLPNTTSLYATRGSSTPSTTPPATPVTPTASVNYTLSNNTLTLAGGTINPGNQVVIRVTGTGTIRITGDILYGPTPTDLAAGQRVPQFILLADGNINIQIADTVTELNGIYSTKGNIYTCATGSTVYNGITSMTSDTCNQALTIKGALIANQVLPYRTAGYNDVNNTTPAETFRLTPEALIGDYQYGQDNPILRTVRQRELPVRL